MGETLKQQDTILDAVDDKVLTLASSDLAPHMTALCGLDIQQADALLCQYL